MPTMQVLACMVAVVGTATSSDPDTDHLREVRQLLGESWSALEQAEAFSFSVVTWTELDPDSVSEELAKSRRWQRLSANVGTPALYDLMFVPPNRFRWSLIEGGHAAAAREQWRERGVDEKLGEELSSLIHEATLAPEGFATCDGETLYVARADRYAAVPAPTDLSGAMSPALWGRYADFNPLREALGFLYRSRSGLIGGQMPELVGEEALDGRAVIRVQGPLGLLRVDPRASDDTPTRVIVWIDADAPHLPVRMHVLSPKHSPDSRQAFEQHLPKHMDDWMYELTFARTIRVIEFRNWNLDPDLEDDAFAFVPSEGMTAVDSVERLRLRAEDHQELLDDARKRLEKRRGEREAESDTADDESLPNEDDKAARNEKSDDSV